MRIKSPFKDYYDFVSYRFGEDPDCTYLRRPFHYQRCFVEWDARDHFRDTLRGDLRTSGRLAIQFVVAGSRAVPVLRRYDRDTMELLVEAHDELLEIDWKKQVVRPALPTGERLAELIRFVGAPVFLVNERYSEIIHRPKRRVVKGLRLDSAIPVLADIGFPSVVPAEQMWQDIYATLTNVLRPNPDKAPPVTVGEKYRIEAAGFDLKTSFRHPVKLKDIK